MNDPNEEVRPFEIYILLLLNKASSKAFIENKDLYQNSKQLSWKKWIIIDNILILKYYNKIDLKYTLRDFELVMSLW